MVSGKDVHKFSEKGLTAEPAEKVRPPLIREKPVNIECKIKKKLSLGSHDLFLDEDVRVHLSQNVRVEQEKTYFSKL